MCAMISGLFIGSNDGRPPQAYKENIVSLNNATLYAITTNITARVIVKWAGQFIDLPEKSTCAYCTFLSQYSIILTNIVQRHIKDRVRVQKVHTYLNTIMNVILLEL